MVHPSGWTEDGDLPDGEIPEIEVPPAPRLPSIPVIALLAVSGVVLLIAPFAFAFLASHHDPVPAPAAVATTGAYPTTATGATFIATAGPGCPTARAASYHRVGSYFNERMGWLHFGTGCVGQTDAIPLSGDAATPDPALYAEWDFHTDPVVRGTCLVEVYIPDSGDIVYNGGDPAHYRVYGSIDGGEPLQTLTIVQPAHLASWVEVGTFPVTQGELRIVMTNEGVNTVGDVPTYRHVSAGAVLVSCG